GRGGPGGGRRGGAGGAGGGGGEPPGPGGRGARGWAGRWARGPPAVSSTEPVTYAARPPSSGWANATLGVRSVAPSAARSTPWKNGEAAASGCTAEHTSCWKPGSVSSCVRQPPPGVGAPSITCTASPARASITAAASPFGPEPTTIPSVGP